MTVESKPDLEDSSKQVGIQQANDAKVHIETSSSNNNASHRGLKAHEESVHDPEQPQQTEQMLIDEAEKKPSERKASERKASISKKESYKRKKSGI